QLLEVLACPVSHAGLEYNADNNELICRVSKLAYPVREGIPVLLETEARDLTSDELAALSD
ncbi:MAG: Trm112 family protein, partial [Pseudomonadales bacterium]